VAPVQSRAVAFNPRIVDQDPLDDLENGADVIRQPVEKFRVEVKPGDVTW
jgi:hypothetical protein